MELVRFSWDRRVVLGKNTWDAFVYFPLGFANKSNSSEAVPQTDRVQFSSHLSFRAQREIF